MRINNACQANFIIVNLMTTNGHQINYFYKHKKHFISMNKK